MPADLRRFARDLASLRVGVVDANVLIYHLEELAEYSDLTAAIVDRAARGGCRIVMSALTVAEVLAGPYRETDTRKVERAANFLTGIPNGEIADLTLAVADRAAWLRRFGLRMPDAVVMATAITSRADAILTNDPVFRKQIPGAPRVMLLDDYTGGGPRPRGR
ncbi:MAG: PIN domain-containing protein [Armatimonadota bacterium]|nr:PIN domain-containing protein [Armatimonadota bacterium]MDR7423248.1 PIN domain-containing protein [Armatimonadota bacterium]MDR7455576.1 PIN domain-containing protein [Armatimonadota bacterium]MDR7457596.1 PIN domain-containing protein [Armatimonadota bacterium]MDR7496650.1 PIN domain-containing protein [Armatimonadota bacterium]